MTSVPFVSTGPSARTYTRDKDGKFSTTSGVRQSLQDASTVEQVSAVLASEASALRGRAVRADLAGSDLDVAREHAEGLLRGFERYPDADVTDIYTYGPGGARPDAFPDNQGPRAYAVQGISPTQPNGVIYMHTIGFNAHYSSNGSGYRESLNRGEREGWTVSGGPMSTALHEFGHVIARQTQAATVAKRVATEQAKVAGTKPSAAIKAKVSEYASTDNRELAAEAFADVMVHSSGASSMSRAIVDEMDARYDAAGWRRG